MAETVSEPNDAEKGEGRDSRVEGFRCNLAKLLRNPNLKVRLISENDPL
jgi:hypothetical protein